MLMNRLNEQLYMTDHTDIDHIIAKFLKQNIDEIGQMSIDEIASSCFVSKGKISKFCRALGYDSFITFKDDCIKETKIKNQVVSRTDQNLELDYLIHLNHSLDAIYQNLSLLDLEKANLLIHKIQQARQIYLYGVAYSNLLCKYIQYELDFLDKEVIVMDESLQKDYIHPGDSLLIVVSVGGNGLVTNQRLFNRMMRYSVEKWILTTDRTNSALLKPFHESLIVPTANVDLRDQRVLLRYTIDILLGRFQYLERRDQSELPQDLNAAIDKPINVIKKSGNEFNGFIPRFRSCFVFVFLFRNFLTALNFLLARAFFYSEFYLPGIFLLNLPLYSRAAATSSR